MLISLIVVVFINQFSFLLYSDIPGRNCKDLLDEGFTESGLYKIQPEPTSFEFTVFCDMKLQGGGWTVILRRVNGLENFNRTWETYSSGFGYFGGDFFLGLERMRLLTEMGNMELHVGLQHHNPFPLENIYKKARYSHFQVGSSVSHYKLTISGYDKDNSTAGDSLSEHSGQSFSTYDEDHDTHSSLTCSQRYSGGWWFHDCLDSNLSGKYYTSSSSPDKQSDGIVWKSWTGEQYSLKTAVMAIRPTTVST